MYMMAGMLAGCASKGGDSSPGYFAAAMAQWAPGVPGSAFAQEQLKALEESPRFAEQIRLLLGNKDSMTITYEQ